MAEKIILGFSGGKDSLAAALRLLDLGCDFEAVFADTGNESIILYEYIKYIKDLNLFPVRTIKADFSKMMSRKREIVKESWFDILVNGKDGCWKPSKKEGRGDEPDPIRGEAAYVQHERKNGWRWSVSKRGISEVAAKAKIEEALSVLQITGIPYLDLSLAKGRFPATKSKFCTSELKVKPIYEQVIDPILCKGDTILSATGVRRDESEARKATAIKLVHQEQDGVPLVTIWNLITDWTVEDVFAIARKHGVKSNPLYSMGSARVGCHPCIHSRKSELLNFGERFPDDALRIKEWEVLVAMASMYSEATFFPSGKVPRLETNNIESVIKWARTEHGGVVPANRDMFIDDGGCQSIYGLCEHNNSN